jgi:hypothetical protein
MPTPKHKPAPGKPKTIDARVVWPDGSPHPSVEPYTIGVTEPGTRIRWTCGHNVVGFVIWCLDPVEFAPAASLPEDPRKHPWVTEFTTMDINDHQGPYTYRVRALHTREMTAEHDPRIQNGGG